ncbi:hypothetical protein MesoLjLc_05380 [Mesorhizobium sp. L-8-10]|nr:hypothetical protein MesoLjLb_05490 [Mesorhizobium sp. L-8-3]BCH28608.1 hypothetical protein MesoLjLc_05380 [Mesorhizobium sp. L-8-10]
MSVGVTGRVAWVISDLSLIVAPSKLIELTYAVTRGSEVLGPRHAATESGAVQTRDVSQDPNKRCIRLDVDVPRR